jgi:hypothetical protein
MPLVLANRVQESATANTTVSFTLTGAIAGFQTFAVIGNTNTTYYSATDGSGNWEVGLGTYSTTGPTLTRTTIYASSNTGSAVTFSGVVSVFVTYPSGRSVNLDGSGNVSALGTVASGTWQGSTIAVAYGGTGVTSSSGANSVVLRDANSNITVNRVNQANTNTTAAGGTTTLTAASSYIQTLVGTGGQTYALPDATTLTTGVAFVFNNLATSTLTITDYATATISTIPSGGAGAVFLTNNGTTGGTWDLHAYLPEGVTFGTNAFNLGSAVISGGTWQGGTIQPAYGGTGLTTFTGANNALYSTGASTLTAGTLPIVAGGTGATTAGGALTSLGAVNKAGDTMTGKLNLPASTATTAGLNISNGSAPSTPVSGDIWGTTTALLFRGSSASYNVAFTNINNAFTSTQTFSSTITATSSISLTGSSGTTTSLGTSATSGTLTLGGTSQTGTMTIGRSTATQTTDIQAGATTSGNTKTVNFGTGGLSGSTTTMNIGSAVSGSTTTVAANGTWTFSTPLVASNGIVLNSTTVSASYTIATGTNGQSVGPITVNSGVTVTVASGQRWLVV